jgi:hypothetical protein
MRNLGAGRVTAAPKAVLQQHCQKNGWPSPKYERFTGPSSQYYYSVTVVQPSMGRGKSKKLGGPVTCKLPNKEDGFASIAVSSILPLCVFLIMVYWVYGSD